MCYDLVIVLLAVVVQYILCVGDGARKGINSLSKTTLYVGELNLVFEPFNS